jgi:hypothetical protein
MDLTDDPLATIDGTDLEADIDKAIDELFVQKSEASKPAAEPEAEAEPAQETAEPDVDLLEPLKESLLSLDWEISKENIQRCEEELRAVSEKLGDDRHVAAVIKMNLGVLKYLHATKEAATPSSIQFLHAATQRLDLFHKVPSPEEPKRRQAMDTLLRQFRRLKGEIQRLTPAAAPARVEKEPVAPREAEPVITEEPALEELPQEETILVARAVEEASAEPAEEERLVEEPAAEQPPPEPAPEAEAAAPPAAEAEGEPALSVRQLSREARDRSAQLSEQLAALAQETKSFFARLLKAVEGKPALEKVAGLFGSVQKNVETSLTNARSLAEHLAGTVEKLQQSIGQQHPSIPGSPTDIGAGLRAIRDSLKGLEGSVARLEQSLQEQDLASTAAVPEEDTAAQVHAEVAEVSLEPEDIDEALEPSPLVSELEEEAEAEPPTPPAPSVSESIYLANIAGTTLGVSTEAVANVFKISKGKEKAVRQRGYAKLSDFRAPFRSLKRGLAGPLAEQNAKALQDIQFPIISLSPEVVGSDDSSEQPRPQGIVLLSTGDRHGALFTDDLMQRTPYEIIGYRDAEVSGELRGTATIEGDFEIKVLDPDQVLS